MSLLDYLFGRHLATDEEGEQRVGVLAGIPMLGLDALGSAAYGPEAALTLLIPLGAAGIPYIGPISTLIITLFTGRLFFLPADDLGVSARRRLVHGRQGEPGHDGRPVCRGGAPARLRAGGGRRHLGGCRGPGLGAAAMLQPYTLSLCLLILAMITLDQSSRSARVGLGIHDSDLSVHRLVAGGARHRSCQERCWRGGGPCRSSRPSPQPPAVMAASFWILMRAFASGCTAMTGVEAVSNGVTAFREPAVPHARRTLTAIIAILGVMLAGIAYLCGVYGIGATEPGETGYQSILSQLVAAVIGRGFFYYRDDRLGAGRCWPCRPIRALPISAALPGDRAGRFSSERLRPPRPPSGLLAGHPRPGGAFGGNPGRLRRDHRSFDSALRRRGFSGLHALAGGDGRSLDADRRAHTGASRWSINAAGAICTAVTLVVVLVSKFLEGAWVMCLLVPGCSSSSTR